MANFWTYTTASIACVLGIVYHAVTTRQQFYSVMLYLNHSKMSILLFLNLALAILCMAWKFSIQISLGHLREVEVERMNEQFVREVTEIMFAMTVFRDDLNLQSVLWITVILFVKSYHWLIQKRVEYIETTPYLQQLPHVRLCTFMVLLLMLDSLCFHHYYSYLLKTRQASVSLFFAFEYLILVINIMATSLKYALYRREMQLASLGQSMTRDVYIFYLELVQDLLHLLLYLLFFGIIFIHYGLPLHLVREVYETLRTFHRRIADFLRYRRLTHNMNERFPDPSQEEVSRDSLCIICRDEMTEAKKLPCGHIFHAHCLRSWLERQSTCPTCRAPILHDSEDEDMEDADPILEQDVDAYEEQTRQVRPTNSTDTMSEQLLRGMTEKYGTEQDNPFDTHLLSTNARILWCPLFIPYSQPPASGTTDSSAHSALYSAILDRRSVPNHSCQRASGTIEGILNAQNFPMWKWTYLPAPVLITFAPENEAAIIRPLQDHPNLIHTFFHTASGLEASSPNSADAQKCSISRSFMPLLSPTTRVITDRENDASPTWRDNGRELMSDVDRETVSSKTAAGCLNGNQGNSSSSGCPGACSCNPFPKVVFWVPGSLHASCNENQEDYLKNVVETLQKQLLAAVELQRRLADEGGDQSPVVATTRSEELVVAEQHHSLPNTSGNSIRQTFSNDFRGQSMVYEAKDHKDQCGHCSSEKL